MKVTAAGQVTVSTLLIAPIAFIVDGPLVIADTNLETWAAIFGLAILSTAFAYVLYFKLLETAGASNLLLVVLLIPVSAILLRSLFLNETVRAVHIAGMLLIALGFSVIDERLWRSKFR